MQLARFLNKLFKKGGFILEDSKGKEYLIGKKENSNLIKIKLKDKSLNYKLLFYPSTQYILHMQVPAFRPSFRRLPNLY